MLNEVFSKEKTQSIIDVMPDEMIVWKVVQDGQVWHGEVTRNRFTGLIHPFVFDNGIQGAENGTVGFHSCVKRIGVVEYHKEIQKITLKNKPRQQSIQRRFGLPTEDIFVSCKISKEWIVKIGVEKTGCLCIVTSRIIMPTYPNTDITKELSEAPLIEECTEAMAIMETCNV